MAAPYANIHAFYDAQDASLYEMFHADEVDWEKLSQALDNALADPFLPRFYRAWYEITHAGNANGTADEEHLQRARDVIEDMRLVYEAEDRDVPYINQRLKSLRELLATVEGYIAEEDDESDDAGTADVTETAASATAATEGNA